MMHNDLTIKILTSVWAIHGRHELAWRNKAASLLKGEKQSYSDIKAIREERDLQNKTYFAVESNEGYAIAETDGSFIPKNSVAIMRISGVIQQEDDICSRGLVSYERELEALGSNANVSAVLIEMNSPGGTALGADVLSNMIGNFEKKFNKPIASLIKPLAASAGYMIISQSPKIFVASNSSEAGSIGTMATFYDDRGFLEQNGVKEVVVNATKSFEKNNPYSLALDGDYSKLRTEILDPLNEAFHNTVKKGRRGKIDLKRTISSEGVTVPEALSGKVYFGKSIIEMGLADEMGGRDEAIKYLQKKSRELNKNSNKIKQRKQMLNYMNLDLSQLEEEKTSLLQAAEGENQEEAQAATEKLQVVEQVLKFKQQETELESLKALNEEQKAKIIEAENMQESITAKDDKIAELEASIETANAENAEKIQTLEASISELNEKVENKETELEELNKDLESYKAFVSSNFSQKKYDAFLEAKSNGTEQPEEVQEPRVLSKKEQLAQMSKGAKSWLKK